MSGLLRDAINVLIVERLRHALERGETINVPDWVSDMVASLGNLIHQQPAQEQGRLILHAYQEIDKVIGVRRN